MNSEDLLQESLGRLESGQPLEDCLTNLPPEEAEMLRLTIALGEISIPSQDSDSAAAQRAHLMSQAAGESEVQQVIQPARRNHPWSHIRSRLLERSRFEWVLAAGLTSVLVVLIIATVWNLTSTDTPPLVEVESGAITIAEDASSTTPEESISSGATPAGEEPVGEAVTATDLPVTAGTDVGAVAPGYEIFVPMMSIPLLKDAQTATVYDVRGVVEVQASDGSWQAIRQAVSLKAGQRLRSASLSSAKLLFYDGSQATISANSEISVDELNALPPQAGFRTVVMTQWLGESEHEVAFRNDRGSRYEVKTPTGSGIARGTIFHVLVTPDLVTHFTVDEGAVSVTNADATVLVLSKQSTVFGPEDAPVRPSFVVTGEGEVTEVGGTWSIAGRDFATTEHTVIIGEPDVGDTVFVRGRIVSDGSLMADLIVLLYGTPLNQFSFVGEVEEMEMDAWTVAGQTISITHTTDIESDIEPGDLVRVRGIIREDGSLLAQSIDLIDENVDGKSFEFTGVVQEIGDEIWKISDAIIAIDGDTEIELGIDVGDVVEVDGRILEEGTWLAEKIKFEQDDEAEFEFTGTVDTIDPWQVSGVSFETDGDTEFDEGIELGDVVRVEGKILEDGTWLAEEIKLLEDVGLETFLIIGKLDSRDPWSVSGIPFEINEDTEIEPGIKAGDLVRVEIVIQEDGTWLAIKVTLFSDDLASGCLTVTALVLGVSDGQMSINGWPNLTIDNETDVSGDIKPGNVVIITMCMADDGTLFVVSIIVLSSPIFPPEPPPSGGEIREIKVTVCHNVERNPHNITIAQPAVQAHLNHGDYLGACVDGLAGRAHKDR